MRTSTEYGTAVWSGEQWSISIIEACGFCVPGAAEPCPYHPQEVWKPAPSPTPGVVGSRPVPPEHAGRQKGEADPPQVKQPARAAGPEYLIDGYTTTAPGVRFVG
jgi:hypothetical protein